MRKSTKSLKKLASLGIASASIASASFASSSILPASKDRSVPAPNRPTVEKELGSLDIKSQSALNWWWGNP
jgi:hypothetical protein